jgi:hypothetical protein
MWTAGAIRLDLEPRHAKAVVGAIDFPKKQRDAEAE